MNIQRYIAVGLLALSFACSTHLSKILTNDINSSMILVKYSDFIESCNRSLSHKNQIIRIFYTPSSYIDISYDHQKIEMINNLKTDKLWEYTDYSSWHEIVQSKDKRFVYILTSHQLLWRTSRLITIDLKTGYWQSKRVNHRDFNNL